MYIITNMNNLGGIQFQKSTVNKTYNRAICERHRVAAEVDAGNHTEN